jgi:hypothetical protein
MNIFGMNVDASTANSILSLIGLISDIGGFVLIGRDLLKHPENRLFWGGGDREFRIERIGFLLIILGFLFQAAGQIASLVK